MDCLENVITHAQLQWKKRITLLKCYVLEAIKLKKISIRYPFLEEVIVDDNVLLKENNIQPNGPVEVLSSITEKDLAPVTSSSTPSIIPTSHHFPTTPTSYLIVYAFLACFAPFIILRLSRTAKLLWALRGVPGPAAVPLVGNIILFTKGNSELYRLLKLCNKIYGSMFQLWIGQRPFVFLFRAEVVQPLLSSPHHIDKSSEYTFLRPWLGNGLVTSTGERWHSRRKLLTNTLHKSVLEVFLSLMSQEADGLVHRLGEQIKPPHEWSEAFDVVRYAKLCALEATCKTIMGINVHEQTETDYLEYVAAIERITSILHQRFLTPWLRPDVLFNMSALGKEHDKCIDIIRRFSNKVIKERKEERSLQSEVKTAEEVLVSEGVLNGNGNITTVAKVARRKALLDLLLDVCESGEMLSDEDIREEVDTFMFAGHDTISSCFSWAMYLLGHHPEIQNQAVQEIECMLGQKLDNGEEITLRDLNTLEYLERCVKESLRLFPVVPLIARDIKTPLTIQGHTLRPGTTVVVATYILHRDPKVFPNPEQFDPDRFCGSEAQDRNPYAYAPFSAGSRNCIGQKFAMVEVKLMLAKVLRHFEIRSIDQRRELRLQGEIVLNNQNGVRLSISKRIKNNNK